MSKKTRIHAVKKFSESEPRFNITILPKTEAQKDYLHALHNNDLVVCTGPAGTGKTFIAASYAARELAENRIDKIVITRANVPTGRSIGYFPGSIDEKLAPWLAPVLSVLKKALGKGAYDIYLKREQIQLVPLETIRGSSYDDAIILVEEAQNLTIEEIKAITTRIGQNCMMVMSGDVAQSDLRESGLKTFITLTDNHCIPRLGRVQFAISDIVRSDITAEMVKLFHNNDM
jgi:phosphate starvation-inducible PhoH-like protein